MKSNNLIWIDLEMTGLDPERDQILEIATIVTDGQLNLIEEGPVIAIQCEDFILENMNEWCVYMHNKTGLVNRVKNSHISIKEAEEITLNFLNKHVEAGQSPMCGNSIGQDRRFIDRYMVHLHSFFHYRNIDVSTIKELARRWNPEILEGFEKKGVHLALEDIRESIQELIYYKNNFII